jgi:hypothetical protein
MSDKYREESFYVGARALETFLSGDFNNVTIYKSVADNPANPTFIKCILKIPVEEKKVTISESEFDEVVQELKDEGETFILYSQRKIIELVKQKLFSKERE